MGVWMCVCFFFCLSFLVPLLWPLPPGDLIRVQGQM
jgi:hypothetical protein